MGIGKIKLKEGSEISSGSLQNPSDSDASYRKKGEIGSRGYVVHGVETCDKENKMNVITHVEVSKNNVDDSKI